MEAMGTYKKNIMEPRAFSFRYESNTFTNEISKTSNKYFERLSRYSSCTNDHKLNSSVESERQLSKPKLSITPKASRKRFNFHIKTPIKTERENCGKEAIGNIKLEGDYRREQELQREKIREIMRKTVVKKLTNCKKQMQAESTG